MMRRRPTTMTNAQDDVNTPLIAVIGVLSTIGVFAIIILLVAEWRRRSEAHALVGMPTRTVVRWVIYVLLISIILVKLDLRTVHEFIYFRF